MIRERERRKRVKINGFRFRSFVGIAKTALQSQFRMSLTSNYTHTTAETTWLTSLVPVTRSRAAANARRGLSP